MERILAHVDGDNTLQLEVEKKELHRRSKFKWEDVDQDALLEFPELTWEELVLLCLGKYQLRVGRFYNLEHLNKDGEYAYQVFRESEGLVRAKLQSRFRNNKQHLLWPFEENGAGIDDIKRWYCRCECGARTLECVLILRRTLVEDVVAVAKPKTEEDRSKLAEKKQRCADAAERRARKGTVPVEKEEISPTQDAHYRVVILLFQSNRFQPHPLGKSRV
ncbi:hypothetical protein FQR65_LT06137 [Abscondita terminalis]|nr:hypothetical protein FQR65_LT06137 [Abscondita terminalis]